MRRRVVKLLGLFFAVSVLAVLLSGCQTVSYYRQAIAGQYQIFANRTSIEKLLANTNTPTKLREKFRLVTRLREFAETELKLPVDGHYNQYVDVKRRFVVWNAHATPQFSLEPKTAVRSEEHTSELQSLAYLVCRLLLEKKKIQNYRAEY